MMDPTRSSSLLVALVVAACGGSSATPDATSASDAPAADALGDAPATGCSVATATFGDLGALAGAAYLDVGHAAGDPTDDRLELDAPLEGGAPTDVLAVQLFAGFGAFGSGAIAPGAYPIAGAELDAATCGVCVRIKTKVTATGYDDDYLATGGTLTVTAAGQALGDTFAGALTGVTFLHVDIDPASGVARPAADGCATSIASATFTGATTAP